MRSGNGGLGQAPHGAAVVPPDFLNIAQKRHPASFDRLPSLEEPVASPRRTIRAPALVSIALLLVCAILLVWLWRQEETEKSAADSALLKAEMAARQVALATPHTGAATASLVTATPPRRNSAMEFLAIEPAHTPGARVGSPSANELTSAAASGTALNEPSSAATPTGTVPAVSDDVMAVDEMTPEQIVTGVGVPRLDPELLIARGDDYFARSDVVSARLLYKRAAEGGSGAAAAAMAATFDPDVLEQRAIRGVQPDPAAALDWYRKAAEMGDSAANARTEALLARLQKAAAKGDGQAKAILDAALR